MACLSRKYYEKRKLDKGDQRAIRYHLNKIDDKIFINCFKKWQEYCQRHPEEYVQNGYWLKFINKTGAAKVKNDFIQKYINK